MTVQPKCKLEWALILRALSLKALIRRQTAMRRVLLSLTPLFLFAVYLYGWRVVSVLAAVGIAGFFTELGFERARKQKPSDSLWVTCMLYTLTLPPTIPYWIAVIGIVFAITFGKQAFGGFGRNVFNPALVGRAFIYVAFPTAMTLKWVEPFAGLPGGFGSWAPKLMDGLSAATPMMASQNGGFSHLQLFLGNTPGSMGESSALLILLAAAYLIFKKTASWKTMISVFVGLSAAEGLFYLGGISRFGDPLSAILSGGFLFAMVFMATDPVSSPSQDSAKLAYGVLIGVTAVIIREMSLFNEGIMFAILIVNAFVPLMDIMAKSMKRRAEA